MLSFNAVLRISNEIRVKTKRLERLRREVTTVKAVDYTRVISKGSSVGNASFTRKIEARVDLERDLDRLKKAARREIAKLHNRTYEQVVFKKYIEFKSLNVIAAEMGITYENAKKIHQRALKNFQTVPLDN